MKYYFSGQNRKKIILIIYDNIFILFNEHCLNPEVFINIKEIVQNKYIGDQLYSLCILIILIVLEWLFVYINTSNLGS